MLQHLNDFNPDLFDDPEDFTPVAKAAPAAILGAQVATADWLADVDAPSDDMLDRGHQVQAARAAFTALNFDDEAGQRAALAQIKVPEAVQHLVGMLTAYDWEFIEHAKHLRGYAVAKIVEETKHTDARVRLKALQMLGNVTEVALFTERVEVSKRDLDAEELRKRVDERLARYLGSRTLTPADGAHVRPVAPAAEVEDAVELPPAPPADPDSELRELLGDA